MDPIHQSAIVRSAADLRILANEIKSAVRAGEESRRKGLEHFREAGLRLIKAKEQLGRGRWLPWINETLKLSERQVQRWMRLAKYDAASDLEEAWRVICGHGTGDDDGDEPETPDEPVDGPPSDNPPDDGEKGDEEEQDEGGAEDHEDEAKVTPTREDLPERYREIFACGDVFDAAERDATLAANSLRKVEESPAYRAMEAFELQIQKDRNFTKRVYSSDCEAAARLMTGLKPAKLCPECKGIEASQDAELCATCGGKGFLIADEVGDD